MQVFIPLHETLAKLQHPNADQARISVLSSLPVQSRADEVYLTLGVDKHAKSLDLKMDKMGASVLTAPAFHYAARLDDDDMPALNAEEYTKRGAEIARSLHFGSPMEYLAAWVNEDRKQAALMRDVHAVLSLQILSKLPQWMRHDLMLVLESETMKQIFAFRFFKEEKAKQEKLLVGKLLKDAVRHNAEDKTDPLISSIMRQVLQNPVTYNGDAALFQTQAAERMIAFHKIV